jgi:hypothetical protein
MPFHCFSQCPLLTPSSQLVLYLYLSLYPKPYSFFSLLLFSFFLSLCLVLSLSKCVHTHMHTQTHAHYSPILCTAVRLVTVKQKSDHVTLPFKTPGRSCRLTVREKCCQSSCSFLLGHPWLVLGSLTLRVLF